MLTRRRAHATGKAGQVAAAAARALAGTPPARRTVRVRRSPTPNRASPASPAARVRNLRTAGGPLHVAVFEGADMMRLSRFARGRFVNLCYTPGYGAGIQAQYVARHFRVAKGKVEGHASAASVFSLLAIKEVDGRPLVVGYAQCTLFSSVAGVPTPRVAKLDLICTQGDPADRLKGAATVLMDELEGYARGLGARVLVLDSVDNPATWGFYESRGFRRQPDACAHSAERDARARANFARVRKDLLFDKYPAYVAASKGLYFPGLNGHYKGADGLPVPDTVFMSKCLGTGGGGGGGAVAWRAVAPGAATVLADFVAPRTRTLSVYGTGVPLPLVRRYGPAGGPVPDIFASSRPATPDVGERRRTRAMSFSPSPSPGRRSKSRSSTPTANARPKTRRRT